MRLNKFVALATGVGRRKADRLIGEGKIIVNLKPGRVGQVIGPTDRIAFNKEFLELPKTRVIMLNKPVGYVVSRSGQGSETIYDILPKDLQYLKPIGRLDKDSSGLLVLTNNGDLNENLTHPRFNKTKTYQVTLNKSLKPDHRSAIQRGVELEDGKSILGLKGIGDNWLVTMNEGRNRQIRRTFSKLGYEVTKLHRVSFGKLEIGQLKSGHYLEISSDDIL